MADVLTYWRDYAANWPYRQMGERALCWHSSARCIAELLPGDRPWRVTSGRELHRRQDAGAISAVHASFLIGIGVVREILRTATRRVGSCGVLNQQGSAIARSPSAK